MATSKGVAGQARPEDGILRVLAADFTAIGIKCGGAGTNRAAGVTGTREAI